MNKLTNFISPLIALVIIFIIWEFLVNILSVPLYILPGPSDIFLSLINNLNELLLATLNTLKITLVAFIIATILAISLAVTFSLSKILEISLYPITVIFQVTPVVAVAPLILIWVGLDNAETAIIILSVIVAFFPVLANTNLGFHSVDKNLKEMFIINKASKWQVLTKLNLPFATPYILTGMKTSIGLALIGAVVAEFVAGTGTSTGLSWIIIESGNRLDIAKLFSALVLLVLLGVFLFLLMSSIEYNILRRWHQSAKDTEG